LVGLSVSEFFVSDFFGETFEVAVERQSRVAMVRGTSLGAALATKLFLFELVDATEHGDVTFRTLDLLKLQVEGRNPLHEVELTEWVGCGRGVDFNHGVVC
jgi:hypothetical protein